MIKKYFLGLVLFFLSSISYGQNAVLCPKISETIKIQDLNNVPEVSANVDGTITLIHSEQYITDVFADYIIYDFFQTYPNSSESLQKYYTIEFGDKALFVELKDKVPPSVFFIEVEYNYTSLNTELIDFLDGKLFRMTNYCSIADNFGEPCPEETVPSDVTIIVAFNYDSINDMIFMESYGLTECENSFSIGLKGGADSNTLQLWKSVPGNVTETNYETNQCHFIEEHLFTMFDISCSNQNYGDIIPTLDLINNTFFLYRNNMVFGYHTATFALENLSVADQELEKIRAFQMDGNSFLQLSNFYKDTYIEVFSVSGSIIIEKTRFVTNQIKIDTYSKGIYFIRLTDQHKNSQMIKFLKR